MIDPDVAFRIQRVMLSVGYTLELSDGPVQHNALQRALLSCNMLHRVATYCSVPRRVAPCRDVLRCVASWCALLRHSFVGCTLETRGRVRNRVRGASGVCHAADATCRTGRR